MVRFLRRVAPLSVCLTLCASAAVSAGDVLPPPLGVYRVVSSFNRAPDLEIPSGVVVIGKYLWGTALEGGSAGPYDEGGVFRIRPDGVRQTMYSFGGSPAPTLAFPGPPIVGPDGNLYGTTGSALFWVNQTTLGLGFTQFPLGPIGIYPGLTSDGGRTLFGGAQTASLSTPDCGAIYAYDIPTGAVRIVATLPAGNESAPCPQGLLELGTSLVYTGGSIFGTLATVQPPNIGAIFSVNANGSGFRIIHTFSGGDGANPNVLVVARNRLYGLSAGRTGTNVTPFAPTLYSMNFDGSNFRLLHRFPQLGSSIIPTTMVVAQDGTICGTAQRNGPGGYLWCESPSDSYTVPHTFTGPPDGSTPVSLIEPSPGVFIGTTAYGGSAVCNCGTVFQLTLATQPVAPLTQNSLRRLR